MMTFTYGETIITLPNPVFDNTESLNIARISRETRGKKQIVFRDDTWPSTRMMTWKFLELTVDEKNTIVTFMQQTLGLEIEIIDYEGRHLSGILSNPRTPVSERYGYTLEIDFEGELS